ncbi:ABC transporter permease [Ruicaihuangia caeni]|uniref:ABC transporter permease n=1 Tax=Ruicaihuangia caeni TaxID=3042517 RepID=A0AAW6T6C2_9MICO|nr:ABC transporter permease [Klugiella sp. YN-L-19]MDI2099381.1 ABC transporter permease [Klugiella sp. YN-L-19]
MSAPLSRVRRTADAPAKRVRRIAAPFIVFAAVVTLWWLFSTYGLEQHKRFLLPPPGQVVAVGLLDPRNRGEIIDGLLATAQVALVGLVLSIVIGTVLALVMSQAVWVEQSIYPWAVVLQTIPVLALVPLIGFWFGYGFGSRVLVCVLIALFPIITSTLFGLQSAERDHRDLFRLRRAGRWHTVTKLLLPGALPAMTTGWRTSAGMSVTGAIVGDFFFRQGQAGIGRLLDGYTQRLMPEQLFAGVFITSAFGLLVFWGFGLITRLLIGSWHESARTSQ